MECIIKGCRGPLYSKGLCKPHYMKWWKYGDAEAKVRKYEKHGLKGTAASNVWRNILARCENKKHRDYRYYGGKEIMVCDRWHKLESFVEDMGFPPVRHCLHRKDSNSGYSKDNCVWMNRSEHARFHRLNRARS